MEYPIYTYEFCGQSYDKINNRSYELVIITQWNDETETAKEICHKTYYFNGYQSDISPILNNKEKLKSIFSEPEFTRFETVTEFRKIGR